MHNDRIFELLVESAQTMHETRRYHDAALTLDIAARYCTDQTVLFKVFENARMCCFLDNDVVGAFDFMQRQEALGVTLPWQFYRDKANYLRYLDRHDEALACCEMVTDHATRNLALGWFLHKQGKTRQAFDVTEVARRGQYWWNQAPAYRAKFWQGEPCQDLVIVAESGSGDQFIFSRWIDRAKAVCGNVYFDGNASMTEVMTRNFALMPFDKSRTPAGLQMIPIMSLANVLQIDDPGPGQYLTARTDLINHYQTRLGRSARRRIGLCCQGEKTHVETTLRTLPLQQMVDALSPLGEVINLQLITDQRHTDVMYLDFQSWEDTLALLMCCDVVVTCDTSIAHAAGALGRPTVVLMHAAAYFTWNHNQDLGKTPWYKNAWCVHQDAPCDWSGSIDKTKSLVAKLLSTETA